MIWWPRDLKPWIIFAAALIVSTLFSWDLGASLLSIPHSRGLGLVQWGSCFLVFLWALNLSDHRNIDRTVLYGGGGLAVLASVQRLAGIGREHVVSGSPILLGEILVVMFPAAWRIHRGLAVFFAAAAWAAHCRSALLAMVAMQGYLIWKGEDRC